MKKLYLDIDGVLLTTKNTRAADGAVEFIDLALSNFECYWLTTHCKDGNCNQVLKLLAQYFPNDIIERLKRVKPTKWDTLKTEGIDLGSDFYWLDDFVFEAEKQVLKKNLRLDNLILVDQNNKDDLVLKIKYMINQGLNGMLPWNYHMKKAIYSMSFKERLMFHFGFIDINCSFKNHENMSKEELLEAIRNLKKTWWNWLFFFGIH